jgi:hypothetical protein
MRVYTYSEARQRLADVLNRARLEGQARIRRRDGQLFDVKPVAAPGSPLDVPAVGPGLSRTEIVELVRESRRSTERLLTARPKHKRVSQRANR